MVMHEQHWQCSGEAMDFSRHERMFPYQIARYCYREPFFNDHEVRKRIFGQRKIQKNW